MRGDDLPDINGAITHSFSEIYRENRWAAGSGTGSKPENAVEYIAFISRFLRQNGVQSVVDFGCGDWQFSRFIDWSGIHYTGIDLVQTVIGRNTKEFSAQNITFKCTSDIAKIPNADLLISKDVFQHLPNEAVLHYLSIFKQKFKWLLITNDDYPEGNLNGVIEPGQWRALRLDLAPFFEDCVCLLSWSVVSNTPTVRKRTILIRGTGGATLAGEDAAPPDAKTQQTVPRRIYQTWKVRAPLPEAFQSWSQTIKDHNPEYEYVLWEDSDNRAFIQTHFNWFLEKYDSYEKEIMRVDAVRYFALFYFGGFYMDMDVECFGSLDRYTSMNGVLLGRMGSDQDHPHCIPNAIMAASPRQEFWLFVFSFLLDGPSSNQPVEHVAGPVFLKRCVDRWHQGSLDNYNRVEAIRALLDPDQTVTEPTGSIHIMKPKEWYPVDWTDPLHQLFRFQVLRGAALSVEDKARLFGNSVLGTYWSHTWNGGLQ